MIKNFWAFKAVRIIFAAILSFLSLTTSAQSSMNEANVQKGVDGFVSTWRMLGMAGATEAVASCYELVDELKSKSDEKYSKFEYCASMDLAAFRYDLDFSKRNDFPQTKFFELENISQRIESRAIEWVLSADEFSRLVQFVDQYVYISFQNSD